MYFNKNTHTLKHQEQQQQPNYVLGHKTRKQKEKRKTNKINAFTFHI